MRCSRTCYTILGLLVGTAGLLSAQEPKKNSVREIRLDSLGADYKYAIAVAGMYLQLPRVVVVISVVSEPRREIYMRQLRALVDTLALHGPELRPRMVVLLTDVYAPESAAGNVQRLQRLGWRDIRARRTVRDSFVSFSRFFAADTIGGERLTTAEFDLLSLWDSAGTDSLPSPREQAANTGWAFNTMKLSLHNSALLEEALKLSIKIKESAALLWASRRASTHTRSLELVAENWSTFNACDRSRAAAPNIGIADRLAGLRWAYAACNRPPSDSSAYRTRRLIKLHEAQIFGSYPWPS